MFIPHKYNITKVKKPTKEREKARKKKDPRKNFVEKLDKEKTYVLI